MKKRLGLKIERLAYKERTKVKVTNQKERVKKQRKIAAHGQSGKPDWKGQSLLIQRLIPMGLAALKVMLESEVRSLAGERYGRREKYHRWGSNPGWVYMGDQKVKTKVPRVRGKDGGERVLEGYQFMQNPQIADVATLTKVICGISQRNYEKAAMAVPETFGIKSSSVNRRFVKASAVKLRAFMERDLSGEDIVAIVLDGKTYGGHQMVIALGITMGGEKILLGFIESETENYKICRDFLQSLIDRGLRMENEILFILDGSKGLRKGIVKVFGSQTWIQRCQWHKRENVLRYLNKSEQEAYRRKLQAAYEEPDYGKARGRLLSILRELKNLNLSAAASLEEGMEETLTLQRLGLFSELGISLKTTNVIENVNRQLEIKTGRVSCWSNSGQRHRWLATALLEIEPRLRPIKGCRYLPALRHAMKQKLRINKNEQLLEAA